MTDLIELAKQVGGHYYSSMHNGYGITFGAEQLQAFADLIRQQEREAYVLVKITNNGD